MAAANLDILIEQGATFIQKLTIKDANSTPVNLTGYTFAAQVRKRYSDPTVIASFSFSISNQTTNTGEVIMTMSASVTSAIPVDSSSSYVRKFTYYTYDVEMDTGTEKDRILEGTVTVSPEVTR